jgi:glycosyltransferase involved in cell wall biosynthesis
MDNKVSVALATYNGAKYLRDQLDSFANQTRRPDELIISDDCSTDETLAIAANFADRAPFEVKIFANDQNLGYPQNFSKALELCTGDIVFLSDQDDVWHPEKIARLLVKFESEPDIQLLIHDIDYCKEDLTPIGQTKIERMAGVFDLQKEYVVGMATAVRSHFLKLCLPVPETQSMSHDLWLHQCATVVGCKGIMPDVLALFRRHGSNATTAAGNLNVDFVTTPDHFSNRAEMINTKGVISTQYVSVVIKWMQSKKRNLVDQGYCSELHVDSLIKEELFRVNCYNSRSAILTKKRNQRFWPVISLYKRGGYRYFGGWMGATQDILFH